MPLISSFAGLLIYMFKEKNSPHNMPHIHVVYGEQKLSISLSGDILAGKKLPTKKQKLLEAWLANREDEINASWIALNENNEVIKVKGIEV